MANGKVIIVATGVLEGGASGPSSYLRASEVVDAQTVSVGIDHVALIKDDAHRVNFEREVQDIEVTGLDFYGHGTDGILWGNDGQPLLANAHDINNIGFLSGKGVDLLACHSAGSLGHSLIDAGAVFVLGYTDEVTLILTPEDLEAMTTAKSCLYNGNTCEEAYQSQRTAMQDRITRWAPIAPDLCGLMTANLRRYRRLPNPGVPGSANARWYSP